MSSSRSTGPDRNGWPRTAYAAAAFWAFSGGAAAISTWRATNADAQVLVGTAAVIGTLALIVGLLVGWRTGSVGFFAAGLIVSGVVTPTTFAYPLNLIPIVTGIWLVVGARRNRRAAHRLSV